jgi:type IV pilus assembly protein PilQ
MNARLSSLLVAGGVVLAAIPSGSLMATTAERESSARASTLEGAALEPGSGTVLNLSIPNYAGQPRLQVLGNPNRVVLDLPGVQRGTSVTRKDIAAFCQGIIQKSRIAQFATEPVPVTRIVLEVPGGTQVAVSTHEGGVKVALEAGSGAIQARMLPSAPKAMKIAAPVETEIVVAKAETPAAIPPAVEPSQPKPAVPLAAMPSVGMPFQTLPTLAVSAVLPTTPVLAQDKPAQAAGSPQGREDVRTGRTLGDAQTRYTGSKMTIDVKGADIQDFLRLIADHAKLNLIADMDVQGIYTFKFTDTPWDQVLDYILKHAGLGKEISNGVIRVAKIEKLQKEEEDRKRLDDAKALAGDVQTISRPLSFAKVSDAKNILEKVITKRGGIIIDERTNTLIITDLPRNIYLIDDLIAQLDVQIQQVQIEARVVEAQKGYEKDFGVKWPTSNSGDAKISVNGADAPWGSYGAAPSWNSTGGLNRPASGQAVGASFSGGKPGVTDIAGAAGEFWVSFLSNKFSVNVILQALEKEGKVKIVSNPKVVTQNNKKAKILSGEKIPYPTQQGGAAGGAITVAFVEANLELDVTPQITNDGTIIMDIKVEKAEADFSTTVQGTPRILRKEVETQVLVKDGGTAVLGGVYTTNTTTGMTGVPFLSKIPILGFLFRSKTENEKSAELLIFITPRILKS